jgi:hypothetical protein
MPRHSCDLKVLHTVLQLMPALSTPAFQNCGMRTYKVKTKYYKNIPRGALFGSYDNGRLINAPGLS